MIGVFDSGLGGLITLKSLIKALPDYDYFYLGDTAYLPYGNKSQKIIYQLTQRAVNFLFEQNCQLIILACHTASAQALRKIQREYLPGNYPKRKVLGVTIPLCEAVAESLSNKRVGVLATSATCVSGSFQRELKKLDSGIKVFCQPAPLLVPIIEKGKWDWPGLNLCLEEYLMPLIEKKISVLALGCTHYPLIKNEIRETLDKEIKIISTDEILPAKLKDYLQRHPEIEIKLSRRSKRKYYVTDFSPRFEKIAQRFFGQSIKIESTNLNLD